MNKKCEYENLLEIISGLGSEFWAAIIGAIIGGIITICAQYIFERINRNRTNLFLGQSVFFKLLKITSHTQHLRNHIEESFQKSPIDMHKQPFSVVRPLTSLPNKVEFTAEELSLVASMNDNDVLNRVLECADIFNSLVDGFQVYSDMRMDFQNSTPAEMEGELGNSSFSAEQMKIIAPKMAMMNDLITTLRNRANRDFQEFSEDLKIIQKCFQRKINLKHSFEIEDRLKKTNEANS